jgi:hypothetical protein
MPTCVRVPARRARPAPLRDRERAVRGRDAAIHGALEQDFLDLVDGETVPQRRSDVHRELVLATRRDERRNRDAAARPAIEARPRPDLPPGVARDEVLELLGEVGRARGRAVDMLVAEHFSPYCHAVVAHRATLVAL